MFRKITVLLCIFMLTSVFMSSSAEMSGKPRMAVIPFANQSAGYSSPSLTECLKTTRDNIESDLVQTGYFDSLSRTEIDRLLDEIKLDHSGLVDPATAAKYGKMVGAQYLVLGSVSGLNPTPNGRYNVHLSLRMIEVETARIFLAGRGVCKSGNDVEEALEKAAQDALDGQRGLLTMYKGGIHR